MDFIFPLVFGFTCSSVFFLYLSGYFELIIIIIKNIKLINKTMKELDITPEIINMYAPILNSMDLKNIGNLSPDTFDMLNKSISTPSKFFPTPNKNLDNKLENKTCISKSGKCMHIYYYYSGTEYMLTVPYNISSSVDMIQYQLDVVYDNGEVIKITQQAGVPYLFSAKDLNCKSLKATNHETDAYHEYKDDVKPNFCEEICDK